MCRLHPGRRSERRPHTALCMMETKGPPHSLRISRMETLPPSMCFMTPSLPSGSSMIWPSRFSTGISGMSPPYARIRILVGCMFCTGAGHGSACHVSSALGPRVRRGPFIGAVYFGYVVWCAGFVISHVPSPVYKPACVFDSLL